MKNNKRLLEFCCTANFDRSTIARATAIYRAREMGKLDYLEISSSGTKAAKIIRLASPMKIRHQVIGLGYNLSVFKPDEEEIVKKVLEAGPDAETNEENRILYARALQVIRGRGGLFIGYALAEKGIPLTENIFNPTKKIEGMDVVLGMKESNVNDVRKIYGENQKPIIETFREFAEAKDPVPDPMGKGLKEYRATVDYFMTHSPTAITKTLDLTLEQKL